MTALIEALRAAVAAPDGVLTGEDAKTAAHSPWTNLGTPVAIVRPRTTEEVAAVVRAAAAHATPITPWGGRTGLVTGANAQDAVALSMERMRAVEAIEPEAGVMRVQTGCTVQAACEAADAAGLLLPLDLGSRGSATIGGTISTNAGGNRVLRYGMMRDMVLGVEAVLADGTVVSALNPLIKNNAGYDIKQLFIGTEGTLGVVTRAVLRLRPKPLSHNVGFVAVEAFEALPRLLRRMERGLGGKLSAFEVFWPEFYQLVTTAPAKGTAPLPHGSPFYVLIEAMGGDQDEDDAAFERALEGALEAEDISDAVIAKSAAERAALWALRDDVGQTSRNGPTLAFDVSLRILDMPRYLEGVRARLPGVVVFGHLGDGNLHLIADAPDRSREGLHRVETAIYEPLREVGGSVSAEHGIGLMKREFLSWSRSPEEIALMRTLKAALDPKGLFNPGKVLTPAA